MKHFIRTAGAMFKAIFPWIGWLGFAVCLLSISIISCTSPKTMNQQAQLFQEARTKAIITALKLSGDKEKQAIDRFTQFLQGIDSESFIKLKMPEVYAENAYLNDTLKSLHGRSAIEAHFVKTSKAMIDYSVTIDDIAESKEGYYIRWTMKFTAPKLAKGKEIVSIGMSYVLFDDEGRVLIHQDFWDSTSGFFEHVPVLGGGIRLIKKRL